MDKIFEESLKSMGSRLILVGILPITVLFLFLLVLVWSGAPQSAPNLNQVIKNMENIQLNEMIILIIAIFTLSLMVQPLQLSLVRFMEGYWGVSWFGNKIKSLGVSVQQRQRKRLEKLTKSTQEPTPEESVAMAKAFWQLCTVYPDEKRLLPTRLGNILRAAEDSAGGRYGLDTVAVWPRF